MAQTDYDIIITGGGLVGASLACALGDSGFRIGIVEAIPPGDPGQPSYDDRTIALAYSSRRIFETIGVWSRIADSAVCAIEHIHITDRGHFGMTRLHADDMDIPALGYVAETRALGAALYEEMAGFDNIELLCPARVTGVEQEAEWVALTLEQDGKSRTVRARLAVAADGGDSPLRNAMGIASDRKLYEQVAVLTNVTPGRPHRNTAYERFTETGPLALLPMTSGRCAVVWSTRPENVDAMMAWSDEEYLAQLQQRFGDRLGAFSHAGKRQAYPLSLTRVAESVRPRMVLIGNAAHTVHPVAGQGFNLGLRDVAWLAQELVEADVRKDDIGSLAVLQRYAEWRTRDNRRVQGFTDGLVRVFSNEFLPLALARNIGLFAVDLFPSIKRAFVRRTSGLNGRLPRLACGLPLREQP
jgi:2-octaprenyl-6-methoxyphenol hydroxylase